MTDQEAIELVRVAAWESESEGWYKWDGRHADLGGAIRIVLRILDKKEEVKGVSESGDAASRVD